MVLHRFEFMCLYFMYVCIYICMYVWVKDSLQFYASYDNKCYNKFLFAYFLFFWIFSPLVIYFYKWQDFIFIFIWKTRRFFSICFIMVWKFVCTNFWQINSKTNMLFLLLFLVFQEYLFTFLYFWRIWILFECMHIYLFRNRKVTRWNDMSKIVPYFRKKSYGKFSSLKFYEINFCYLK